MCKCGSGGGGWAHLWNYTVLVNSINSENRQEAPSSTDEHQAAQSGRQVGRWGVPGGKEQIMHFTILVTIKVPSGSRCCYAHHPHNGGEEGSQAPWSYTT